jgi:hypothetical protein
MLLLNVMLHLVPYDVERGRCLGHLCMYAVYRREAAVIIIIGRLYQPGMFFGDKSLLYSDEPHLTYTPALIMRCFEIYGCEGMAIAHFVNLEGFCS